MKSKNKEIDKLEKENAELRKQLDKHFDVYRSQLYELVDCQLKLKAIQEILNERREAEASE